MLTRARGRDERGAVAVVAAVLFVTLFTVAALVVQFGFTRDVQQGSQNAADASALAAAYSVAQTPTGADIDAAVGKAIDYAEVNFGTDPAAWSTCTDAGRLSHVTARTDCVSFDHSVKPTRIRVLVPVVETKTDVGAGAGVDSLPISRVAEASVTSGAAMTCGLCFLGKVDSGNADYTVTGTSIAVNGDVELGSTGHMTAVGGTISIAGVAGGSGYSPNPPVMIEPFTDPWASRSDLPPSTAGLSAKTNPCDTATGGQGVYGALELPNSTCTLQPGLYVVTGAWTSKNSTVLAGSGVTLYFTCGTTSAPTACGGVPGGRLDAKNGQVSIVAPTTTSTTNRAVVNVAIAYDRGNTASLGLQGNGSTSITGAVYAPRSHLDFNGNSCFGFKKGPVIVHGVIMANGTKSCVHVTEPIPAAYAYLPGSVNLSR